MVPQKVADLKERDLYHPAIKRCSVQHLSTSLSRVLDKPGNSSNAETTLKRRRKSPHSPSGRGGWPERPHAFLKFPPPWKIPALHQERAAPPELDTHDSNQLLCVGSLSLPLLVLKLEPASSTPAMLDQAV
jgi:hypothetical protein